jgi:hypothetical protein
MEDEPATSIDWEDRLRFACCLVILPIIAISAIGAFAIDSVKRPCDDNALLMKVSRFQSQIPTLSCREDVCMAEIGCSARCPQVDVTGYCCGPPCSSHPDMSKLCHYPLMTVSWNSLTVWVDGEDAPQVMKVVCQHRECFETYVGRIRISIDGRIFAPTCRMPLGLYFFFIFCAGTGLGLLFVVGNLMWRNRGIVLSSRVVYETELVSAEA